MLNDKFWDKIRSCVPDDIYLKYKFKKHLGYSLNLKHPKTFNEKLQWLKLYDRKPEYTMMVDKYAVKKYIAATIGSEYVIPTLGVWNRFDEIDFDTLPNQFILKCTHDSGGVVICRDKSGLDLQEAQKKIESSLANNFYYTGREWPYKHVSGRILAEQYLGENLPDYKLFCFNGVPRITLVCSQRFTEGGLKEDFYDADWNHLEMQRPNHGNSAMPVSCPTQYDLMKSLAAKLSKDIPFVRVDFYEVAGKVYFGEMTFYPASGFEGFVPKTWDTKLGEWVALPRDESRGNIS